MRLIDAGQVVRLLPMAEAIALMRTAFVTISEGSASLAHRQALQLPGGTGLLMGAARDGVGLGMKLAAIVPGNAARGLPGSVALALLHDEETGEPRALIDGTALTALRTAALNGCAMDLLARRDVAVGLLVGAGTQAASQLLAMDTVRDLREIRVLGRDAARAGRFVQAMYDSVKARLVVAKDPAGALEGVDVVVAATNSESPVVAGARVPAGCHVSGIGSFRPTMCEFDDDLLGRARIFVESRDTALAEAGELIAAERHGVTYRSDWTEVGEVLGEVRPGRRSDGEITFFKSVGHSVFDLYAARAIVDRAEAASTGTCWDPRGQA